MDYKIALCDDEEALLRLVSGLVGEWAAARQTVCGIETFPSAEAFLFQYQEDKSYDILLLDIKMTGMDGVTMATAVRREDEAVQIIFLTGYSDYILEGFEVAALHYLMKPVDRKKLFTVLDRAVEKLRKNERALTLELPGELVRVPLYEIRCLEVRQNYVTVHAKEDYTVKKPLGEFQRELDERFFRTGRSCIVNLACVRRVTRTEVFLDGGLTMPLSRGLYDAINRAIISRS